ncbi:hypothetical protein KIN20_037533 [Parelaphostrongylus tenuis]|uniref:Uncharacterized protein n=1 Tax=Parelaphostrongylus tenuis TaxID=148309 RepID=A0AAD5RE31_PARTN|nr:hypothetical protein KIN20_037533 [Parelaphostrongylus tenuis]
MAADVALDLGRWKPRRKQQYERTDNEGYADNTEAKVKTSKRKDEALDRLARQLRHVEAFENGDRKDVMNERREGRKGERTSDYSATRGRGGGMTIDMSPTPNSADGGADYIAK